MFAKLSRIPCELVKKVAVDCWFKFSSVIIGPFSSKSNSIWLAYLDKVENLIRQEFSLSSKDVNETLFSVYEVAMQVDSNKKCDGQDSSAKQSSSWSESRNSNTNELMSSNSAPLHQNHVSIANSMDPCDISLTRCDSVDGKLLDVTNRSYNLRDSNEYEHFPNAVKRRVPSFAGTTIWQSDSSSVMEFENTPPSLHPHAHNQPPQPPLLSSKHQPLATATKIIDNRAPTHISPSTSVSTPSSSSSSNQLISSQFPLPPVSSSLTSSRSLSSTKNTPSFSLSNQLISSRLSLPPVVSSLTTSRSSTSSNLTHPSSSTPHCSCHNSHQQPIKSPDMCDASVQVEQPSPSETDNSINVNGQIYRIIGRLGQGGSSIVHSALDTVSNKAWAIKEVNLVNASNQLIESYSAEIDMLESLHDSGRVIRLHAFERQPKKLLLVLEKADLDMAKLIGLEMEDFAAFKRRSSVEPCDPLVKAILPSHVIVFYWMQMLACVKSLHDRSIVHLDLKPQNFVWANGRLKLIDLGISQRLPDDSTRISPSLVQGTLTYMSPEQLQGSTSSNPSTPPTPFCLTSPRAGPNKNADNTSLLKVGRKSDVWSLGVILYIMIYGRSPFPQQSERARIAAIISPDLPILFPPIRNKHLFKALARCLERDYKKRATVDELLSFDYVD